MYAISYKRGGITYQLYHPQLIEDGYAASEAAAHFEANTAGSATISIQKDHVNAGALKRRSGIIEISDDGEVIFRGQITRDVQTLFNLRTLEVAGIISALNDTYVEPYSFPSDYLLDPGYQAAAASGNVVAFWLGELLDAHNDKVGAEQQIHLGTVTVTDPNNYISRSNEDYSTTWETISEKLFGSSLGGYIMPRYEADGTYLDYLAGFPDTNAQDVRFARNLMDLNREQNGEELFTDVLALGKDGLDLSSIADTSGTGYVKEGKIVYSPAAETEIGGRIIRIVKWDDVEQVTNLLTKAATMVTNEAGSTPRTVTAAAADLSGIEDVSSFRIGKLVRVIAPDETLTAPLTALDVNLLTKSATQITVGDTQKTLSSNVAGFEADVKQTTSDIKGKIREQTESSDAIAQRVTTVESSLTQTASDIQATVSMISELGDNVEAELTQIRQDQSGVEIAVENIRQNGVDKVVTQTGFRFDEDGLTVSKSGTPMETNIDEDGMEVTRSGERVLVADSNGVNAINLTARQYLTIGLNSRFEDYKTNRTACFFVGG